MRLAMLLWVAAGCGESGIDCKASVERAAKHFGRAGASEVATLIGECTQRGWNLAMRSCFANAKDSGALEDCLPPLDVKIPAPVVEPSKATVELASKFHDVRALLFYAPNAEVVPILDSYFKALGGIAAEHHDRLVEAANASRWHVSRDRVVIVRGESSENIDVDADLARASRVQLPGFDRAVADAISRVTRPQRRVYLTVGHGEVNDPDSVPTALAGRITERRTTVLRSHLEMLDYKLANLAPEALAADVPADATVVMVLAPAIALAPDEDASLGRYLDRGGAVLFALDPTAPPGLGALETRLGVVFDHGHLVDDQSFIPNKHELADHRLVITNKIAAHPSTRDAARATSGILLNDSGTLSASTAAPQGTPPNVTFTVQSMPSSFVDANGSFELDGAEKRGSSNVIAAVSRGAARAAVLADVDILTDVLVANAGRAMVALTSPGLVDGTIAWLGGEERLVEPPSGDGAARLETKASLTAERELLDRRRLRKLARALAAPDEATRENAASDARHLERDLADLREKIDKATK